MQPGVTVFLATAWLAVYVVGTSTLHLPHHVLDQYSPLPPHQDEVYGRVEGQLDWKDQNPAENQPFDLSIRPRRFIASSKESQQLSQLLKHDGEELMQVQENPFLVENKQSHNFFGPKVTNGKVDDKSTKKSSLFEQPPSELEDSFVADDTFQDQGPGSVEIYKLDLLRTRLVPENKSKMPKKTSHANSKTKMPDYKATSPKLYYKQSNSFDDTRTQVPIQPNSYQFGVGGVPELQVGCEGLAAREYYKRSIDSLSKDKKAGDAADLWASVTPISLDLDYDFSSEEGYEEMDELVKLKKSETVTEKVKQNRGDMEATLHSEFFDDKSRAEKLPVRGDLGKFGVVNESSPALIASVDKSSRSAKTKRDVRDEEELRSVDSLIANRGRKILWLHNSDDEKRLKRAIWGFGEDDGVLSSDELQTETQRRRQEYERRLQEAERRKQEDARRREYAENRTTSEIERTRNERLLEKNRRGEEERLRHFQESQNTMPNPRQREEYNQWLHNEEIKRKEERKRQELEASRRRYNYPQSSSNEEERRRQLQAEELKRQQETRLREEERRRQQTDERAKWEEQMRRRQQQELDRQNVENRRRQWLLKRKQQEEEKRRRQERTRTETPSNLLEPGRRNRNDSRPYETEADRRTREQQERERELKLREYIQRNRPMSVNTSVGQQREQANSRVLEEERRRKMEEERKLQEYIRRNQPVQMPKTNGSYENNLMEYRRPIIEARPYDRSRYSGPETGRRNHGPSAPTNSWDSWGHVDESRRREAARRAEEERIRERQRQEEEHLRKEMLTREEEVRRMQARRYEEQRKRLEAANLEAERRAKELVEEQRRRSEAGRSRPFENTRPGYGNRQRFEEHRRRQDTSLIPANLLLNDSRRAIELERQRHEQERRRIEAERRRQEEIRVKESRGNQGRAGGMKEQRQEEARLNALPVSARIIIRPGGRPSTPNVFSRSDFENDIGFLGINPNNGVPATDFLGPVTRRPPVISPPPCVWAVVGCCPSNVNRLAACFESLGCPGINWDPNPCRGSITQAARRELSKFYAEADDRV